MELRTRRVDVGGVPVVELIGEVDLATVGVLRDALIRALSEARGIRVAVDLDGVSALDDVGLGVILGAAGRAREHGGDLIIVCTNDQLMQRFAKTGLDRAMRIARSVSAIGITPV